MNDIEDTQYEAGPPARPSIAILLSFLAPGLGVVYVGRLMAGLVINLLFILVVLLFVIAITLFHFFPLYSAAVLAITWLVMCSLSAWTAVELIDDGKARRTHAFQHPLVYALIAIATFAGPLMLTAHFTARHLVTIVSVDDPALVPQADSGDYLLVDRTAYRSQTPQRGDLVTIRHPDDDRLTTLRVVGIPDDEVAMNGFTLAVNEDMAHYAPLTSEAVRHAEVERRDDLDLLVEHNDDRRYVISLARGASHDRPDANARLGEDEYFLLADKRTVVEEDGDPSHSDSRHFAAIDASHVEGRPLYVAWSTSPESGDIRWDRIGLPVR